jgi:hypothetical protein
MKKDTILLPNLLFEKNNIYFKFKKYFELEINNKKILFDKFLLNNISLYGTIYFKDIKINCDIIKKENKDGLLMELTYNTDEYFNVLDIQIIAKKIEKIILNINNQHDDKEEYLENNNSSSLSSYMNDENSEHNADVNNNYCNYYSSTNYDNTDQISDSSLDDTHEINYEYNNHEFSKFNSI